jgi:hypothetical protein
MFMPCNIISRCTYENHNRHAASALCFSRCRRLAKNNSPFFSRARTKTNVKGAFRCNYASVNKPSWLTLWKTYFSLHVKAIPLIERWCRSTMICSIRVINARGNRRGQFADQSTCRGHNHHKYSSGSGLQRLSRSD